MLDTKEAKYVLTTEDGKMFACYSDLESAELDAKDLVTRKPESKFRIYELKNTMHFGDKYVQNSYELKSTYPEP